MPLKVSIAKVCGEPNHERTTQSDVMQKMQEQDRTKNQVASRRKGGEQDTNGNREDESRIPPHPPQIGAGQRRQQSEPSDEQEKNQSDAPKQKKMQ